MKKLVVVSAIVLGGACAPALAQTTETPPPGAVAPPAAEREGVRPSTTPGVARENDPNAIGDDKINGLEVPQMKDPREGGGSQ